VVIPMTVKEAFSHFELEMLIHKGKTPKTRENYQVVLNSFVKANGDVPIELIDHGMIVRWEHYMLSVRANELSTVASNLSRLRKVVRYLQKHGYGVYNPDDIECPKVPPTKTDFLEYDEIQSMIDTADRARDKALIACLFSTMCRITELLNLNKGDLHGNEAMVTGKFDKSRPVYFDDRALHFLNEYLDERTDNLRPLFVSGQRQRLGYARANQLVHELADAAGIDKHVRTHIFRHSGATDMMMNGAPIMVVKEILGHTDVSTTMRYQHVTDQFKKESFSQYHTNR
jgi:integrase/recombinase XerC